MPTVVSAIVLTMVPALSAQAATPPPPCKSIRVNYKPRKLKFYKSFLAAHRTLAKSGKQFESVKTDADAKKDFCTNNSSDCTPGFRFHVGTTDEGHFGIIDKGHGVMILPDSVWAGACASKLGEAKSLGNRLYHLRLEELNSARPQCGDDDEPERSWNYIIDPRTQRVLVGAFGGYDAKLTVKGDVVTVAACSKTVTYSLAQLRKEAGYELPPKNPSFGSSAKALLGQGRKWSKKRWLTLGIEAYSKATKLDPNNGSAWAELGYALYRDGQLPKALTALTKALPLKPKPGFKAAVHYNIGLVHAAMGHPAKAKAAWQKSHELKPTKATRKKLGL